MRLFSRFSMFVFLAWLLSIQAFAQIQLPALVGDHMVLQQKATVTVWGWSSPGEEIMMKCGWVDQQFQTHADTEGNWQIEVPTVEAGGPYTIKLSGKNEILIDDVMLGEVWLCSGQSNMFFPLGNIEASHWQTGVPDYQTEVVKAVFPKLRLFTVATEASFEPLNDVRGKWKICTPASANDFSAVAYFFGKYVHEHLNVPVGLIASSWGGTQAESWTQKEVLQSNPDFVPILERFEERQRVYREKMQQYAAAKRQNPDEPIEEPKRTQANKDPFVLYNAMIYPLLKYNIKGAIWYQGESNKERAYQYRSLFPAMVANWREAWDLGQFPFYYVQIAPHRGQNPEIREAQLLALDKIANSGMVVSTDHGNPSDIHPKNKKPIGERLAFWALSQTYGDADVDCSGPLYDYYLKDKHRITIFFKYAENGLSSNGQSVKGFEIAGNDQKFYPAEAILKGNTVTVKSDQVEDPVAVRYGWENSPQLNLFDNSGLPASPFRTDDWPQPTKNEL